MNKRIRNRLLYGMLGVMVAAGVTYACKDFLDQPAQGALDEGTLANQAGVEASLIAAYRSLDCSSSSAGSWGCAASNWVWGSVAGDDAYKGSEAGDQQPINDIETYYWAVASSQTYLNQKWSQVYEGVFRANSTIRFLEKVCPTRVCAAILDTLDVDGIRGEALFLRAHYHFEALRMWGNIPYYFENDFDFRKPNDLGPDSVVTLIINDLNAASALLQPTPRNDELGRATSWTAKAYKGRVQVYGAATRPALWDSALVTLRAVRASNVYALEQNFARVWTGFTQYQNGPETIFAFQASVRDGQPDGWNSNWGEQLNFPYNKNWCCGFHQASFNLVNFFRVDSAGLPLALTDTAWNNPTPQPDSLVPPSDTIGCGVGNCLPWKGQNFWAGNLAPVDPRLDWTVGRDGVPFKDWGVHKRNWIRDASYSGPYSAKKNIHEDAADAETNAGWNPTASNDVNIHIFRYADLLLLLAEAEVEVGTLANALAIVNQVRARAGQVAQGCGSADSTVTNRYASCVGNTSLTVALVPSGTLDSVTTPWARYRIGLYPSFPNQAYARTAVRYERRLELAMEGQRFFDLRRWGAADTTLNNYLTTEKTRIPYLASAAVFSARHALYPLPDIQVQLSRVGGQDRLVQNPGW